MSAEETPTNPAEGDEDTGGIKLFNVKIPDDKKPGDHFTYTDEDNDIELEMVVPEDKKGGDTMEILIDDGDDDIEAVTVDLGNGVALNLVTFLDEGADLIDLEELAKQTAEAGDAAAIEEINNNDEDDDDDSDYEDMGDVDGTNFMVWPAGVELAQLLASSNAKVLLDGKRNAVELGSGVGAAGMALAAAFGRNGDAPSESKVTLTDMPVAMSLLTANFKENEEAVINGSGVTVDCKTLVWGSEQEDKKKYDLVIGADLLYNAHEDEKVIGKLTSTIDQLLTDNGSIVFAQRWRNCDAERKFFEDMEKLGYTFTLAKKRIEELGGSTASEGDDSYAFKSSDLSWKEFGSSESEASKKYFSETKFKTMKDGEETEKSLVDIDELDLECMEEDAFDACELAQIQVFVGYKN